MGAAAVRTLLEQGDLASAVPRLGGMARANGVVIVSERYWAFAGRDGSLREGRMPVPPRALRSIPLARGLVHTCAQARITGVAFFDFKHGQTGLPPNAIELHPILGFRCGP